MNIILFGFKGCGKTTIGKVAAITLNMKFIDIDRVIEKIYNNKEQEKLTFRKIYKKIGEDKFRKLEKEAILSIININNSIIATGGGNVLKKENVETLEKIGTLIYLQTNKNSIKERMLSQTIPAFLDLNNPDKSFEKMYNERKEIYENIASIVINTDNKTTEEIATKIAEVKNGK